MRQEEKGTFYFSFVHKHSDIASQGAVIQPTEKTDFEPQLLSCRSSAEGGINPNMARHRIAAHLRF